MSPPSLAFDAATATLSGSRGQVVLDPGPALLTWCMIQRCGHLVPRADLVAVLDLPPSVGTAADSVLRDHLRTVRVLTEALSGGRWTLRMQGQDAAGLFGPPVPKVEVPRGKRASRAADVVSIAARRPSSLPAE